MAATARDLIDQMIQAYRRATGRDFDPSREECVGFATGYAAGLRLHAINWQRGLRMAKQPKRPKPVGIEAELITMTKALTRIATALEKLVACTGNYGRPADETRFFRISDLGD